MKSFLHQYDLKGKTVIPFNSNGGYGIGRSFQTVKELCPNSNVLEGFTTRGGSERDGQFLVIKDERAIEVGTEIDNWLKKIKHYAFSGSPLTMGSHYRRVIGYLIDQVNFLDRNH